MSAAIDHLDRAVLDAHADGDEGAIARAYLDAADAARAEGESDRACFFLTHAWIFALEAGDPLAAVCHARLEQAGRV